MAFTINETTIGIEGASGKVWLTKREDGIIRDVICHMKIPGHWIFNTERKLQDDPIMIAISARFGEDPPEESTPVGKNGPISLDYEFASPRAITYWKWRDEEIGWYGWSTDMAALVNEFKEMGEFLRSAEAKAQFDALYGNEDPRPLPAPAGAGAGLSDEERREKNRKAKERAKARKAAAKEAAKTAYVPVGMAYRA